MNTRPTTYLLDKAWVDGSIRDNVLVTIAKGRFVSVETVAGAERGSSPVCHPAPIRIRGLTLPGLANGHSHAFQRALRGVAQRGLAKQVLAGERGSFWTWREQMYALTQRLDPDSYFALARASFREMVSAGITAVGEFHYLHHQPDGSPYDDPNAMGHALVAAAGEAGVRITLLDTCYLSAGFGSSPSGAQVRYNDQSAARWAKRVDQLRSDLAGDDHVVVGSAIHSVRAVPAEDLPRVAEAAAGMPLHLHLSEQIAENEECQRYHGVSPTRLLYQAGALGPDTTAIHATHVSPEDIQLLGSTQTRVCFCPTTERDLGDGVGPRRALRKAGCPVSLGTDSHTLVDMFEEMRAVEFDERQTTSERGHWTASALLNAGVMHESLGFADAGAIRVGARADLVTVALNTVRTAGTGNDESTAVFAATATDVTRVVVDGRVAYTAEDNYRIGLELADAVDRVNS